MEPVNDIFALLEGEMSHSFAVFLRLSAFFALMPAFGEQSIPTRIKLGLALGLTIAVAPAVPNVDISGGFVWPIFSEIAAGAMLGIGMRLFVMALQTAGSIAAQATSLSQLLGGNGAEPLPAIGHVLVVSGLALISILGLHVKAVQFFVLSYDILPGGALPNAELFGQWGVYRVATAFGLAFSLAAPFVILSVLYNLALGAINRAMPQLMVALVGAPLITGASLALLMLASPIMLLAWVEAMEGFMRDPLGRIP